MLEVDVDNLEAQLPVLLDELLTGGGALVVREAFPPADIAEARRLITHYSSTEATRSPTSTAPTRTRSICSDGCGTCSTRARSSNGWSSTPW